MLRKMYKWLFITLVFGSIMSCAPNRQAAYFRNDNLIPNIDVPDKVYNVEEQTSDEIKVGDELYITVTSGNDDPNSFGQSGMAASLGIDLISYKVDENGNIWMPYLNKVTIEGMSIQSLVEYLEKELSEYIYLPSVSARFINNRVTVLGEVNMPGVYVFNRVNVSVYEVLASAGDIAPFGNRKNVLIVRRDGDKILRKQVDLTNDAILNSPWYEVKTDDIIYIEPLGRRALGMETFSIFQMLSLVTGSLAIYALMSNL